MPVELALYQPDIAQNTGTILRLAACLGVHVHVIHPTGFPFSRAHLKRTGLDYLDHVALTEHVSFSRFDEDRRASGKRLVLLTTKGPHSIYAHEFAENDVLMVGRESAGVPEAVARTADYALRIPMRPGLRSINVALAATLGLGEALRQTQAFEDLA